MTHPTSDHPIPSETSPAARTLRVVGLVVFYPALVLLLLALVVAWFDFDPDGTGFAFAAALVLLPFLVVAIVLVVAGSVWSRVAVKRWEPAGGLVARASGVCALVFGLLLLVGAFVVWSIGRGDADATAMAGRALRVGVPLSIAGGLLAAGGNFLARRASATATFAGLDAAAALAVVIVGFALANPWAVGTDLAAVSMPGLDARDEPTSTAAPLESFWFNGTLRQAARAPVLGGINGPNSDATHEFKLADPRAQRLVVDANWSTPDTLVVILEQGADGAWEELGRATGPAPLRLEQALATPDASLRVRVFPADEPAAITELAFTLVEATYAA